ncbi:hypothetical protein CBR_g57503 [Chara braunii]|uniref:RRM domain-containing protein n=1 Tax=Chara braunii TaxID=69332 RepID=A0A388ME65_CHABU|nr:hypothetical protein CBR_g57503 [Chara braunii]|eukprot:GBG92847.1 hypothetical protein CBR_g57503 [Chara braunii]
MLFQKLGGALRVCAARSCLLREAGARACVSATTHNRLFTTDEQQADSQPTSKLFVGGLAWAADDNTLRNAFAEYGSVTEAKVIVDRVTGRSRGYGFVSFETEEDASKARDGMNNQEWMGRIIRVDWAVQKSPEERLMSRGSNRRFSPRGDYGSSSRGGGWSSGGMSSYGGM